LQEWLFVYSKSESTSRGILTSIDFRLPPRC
jgi:hypothetical protein